MGRTASRRLLALCLLGSLSAHAASPVWAIRGAHNTVYLAGSVHLLPAEDAVLPQGFDRAYADSSKLVMELDLGKLDPLEAAGWMIEHAALPAGTTLRGMLGEQRYSRVSAAAAELGAPIELLDGQAPWAVGVELAELEFLHQGFDPEQGVEQQLVQRAQADGKSTAGLESLAEELGSLEALSSEDQLRLLDQTVSDLKQSQGEVQEVLRAWRQDRNAFVVVGALHLVGDGGLLELLRKDGFTAQQLN
ncbi:MAG: TraB/GumN family protein [Gammaproteobacteria bacterium]|nr:MAG: TraB/GumN family protein [Gammaproteobacteria bacterium]